MNSTSIDIRSYSGLAERHRHPYHQIIMPCKGMLEIEVERTAGRVGGSIGSFVQAGSHHTFLASQANAFIVLDVPVGRGPQALDHAAVPAFFAIGPDVRGLLDYMIAVDPRQPLAPPLRQAWADLLLDRLPGHDCRPDKAEMAVRRATSYMQRRLADPIRIGDIAQAAGMSPSRLHDAFLRRRDATPHALLVALRLDAAERLLADPSLPIAEVALRSGHADQSALTRAMRRERGTTPAQVRRRLLGKPGEKA